ncbi:MAG: hypothetical protein HY721_11875 [Planctomycetes bacterium]|nr:hypothetical protein [Planctomycetota bacterium]
MPRVRRAGLPSALFRHLLERIQDRKVPAEDLERLAAWLDKEPEVPEGRWYKRFPGVTLCGEGEWVKTFLEPGQLPAGKQVH